jgi:hypothetical protein
MNKPIDHISRDILADFDRDHANLEKSLKQADAGLLGHLLDVQHLLSDCFTAFLAREETHKRISAFGIYEIEAIHLVQRACMQALCWYYGIGTAMLRSALEALIRGAFWEGMAHKVLRDSAEIVRRAPGVRLLGKTGRLDDWFTDIFAHAPQTEADLETVSAGIFDRVSPLFSDPALARAVPPLRVMVEQIAQWGLLTPIPEAASALYDGVYWKLSDDAHLIPDKTLLGRRFAGGKTAFPTVEFSATDLKGFIEMLEIVADIGIVLSLNSAARILPDARFAEKQFQALAPRMREILPNGYCGDWKTV